MEKYEYTVDMANSEIEKHLIAGASVEDVANAIAGSDFRECIVNKYEGYFNANTDVVVHRRIVIKHIKRTFKKLLKERNHEKDR